MAAALKSLPVLAKGWAAPRWATLVKYGRIELMPPSPTEIPVALGQLGNLVKSGLSMKWTQTPVKEATVNTLVAMEVVCWFFIGECIGKGCLVGYQV